MQKSIGTLIAEIILAVATITLLASTLWLIFGGMKQKEVPNRSREAATNGGGRSAQDTFDADDDGLLDWEETLWQTNPQNADTDGDGVGDGEEVAARRNPLQAGPHDELDTPIIVPQRAKETPPPKATAPEKALAVPQTNTAVSPPKETTPNDTPLYLYGNEIGAPVLAASVDQEMELAFLNSIAGPTKMDEERIAGLDILAKKYNTLAEDIAAIIPPPEAEVVQAELASAYKNYAKAIQSIAETPTDSYMSYASITAYSNAVLEIGRALVGVSDFFYSNGIRFPQNEPGAVFMFPR
jgi:hypothetical protein